ncbi:hypothetical protein HPB47_023788 [Ixodes persulcatus]|uniref:Uncharacterized protein n=1 Tax=Ixodes persulcatus TaxID=34615 RepID=A0AC60Q6F3_IXOPE|nr:hypothetical protein HPB47_023788 [Ixodes persulcatus]
MHLRTSQATILYWVQLKLAQARLHGHNVRLQWIPSHWQLKLTMVTKWKRHPLPLEMQNSSFVTYAIYVVGSAD